MFSSVIFSIVLILVTCLVIGWGLYYTISCFRKYSRRLQK